MTGCNGARQACGRLAEPPTPTLADRDAGWQQVLRAATTHPAKVAAATDLLIYELPVRDFSIGDATVSAAHRGKYGAFTETGSDGMRHLQALADAGLTEVAPTCCNNTATEHLMMARLMMDSAVLLAREHQIDSCRFNLRGHQPRAVMQRLQRAVNRAAARRSASTLSARAGTSVK